MIMFITITIFSIIGQTDKRFVELKVRCNAVCCIIYGDNPPPHPAANSHTAAWRQSIQRGMHNEHENDKTA